MKTMTDVIEGDGDIIVPDEGMGAVLTRFSGEIQPGVRHTFEVRDGFWFCVECDENADFCIAENSCDVDTCHCNMKVVTYAGIPVGLQDRTKDIRFFDTTPDFVRERAIAENEPHGLLEPDASPDHRNPIPGFEEEDVDIDDDFPLVAMVVGRSEDGELTLTRLGGNDMGLGEALSMLLGGPNLDALDDERQRMYEQADADPETDEWVGPNGVRLVGRFFDFSEQGGPSNQFRGVLSTSDHRSIHDDKVHISMGAVEATMPAGSTIRHAFELVFPDVTGQSNAESFPGVTNDDGETVVPPGVDGLREITGD